MPLQVTSFDRAQLAVWRSGSGPGGALTRDDGTEVQYVDGRTVYHRGVIQNEQHQA